MAPARTPRLLLAGYALLAAASCGVPVQSASAPAALGGAPEVQEARTPPGGVLDFGVEHTFAGGVSITVSTPKSFQPSASAYPRSDRAAAFDVEVRNLGSQPYRLSGLSVTATSSGAQAIQVLDSTQGFTGIVDAGKDLTPGRAVRLNLAFAVPSHTVELRLVFRPDAAGLIAAYSGLA